MQRTLIDAFNEVLATPRPKGGALAATNVPGRVHDYVSLGEDDQPVILLSCVPQTGLQRPPIRLQHISVEFGISFRVQINTSVIDGDFVVISLRSLDSAFVEPFCLAAEALLSALPTAPSSADIDRVVREFVELMTSLTLPSTRAVAGLWAELWLMTVAAEPKIAVSAWHATVSDRYDFAFQEYLVEVKATEKEERNHEFSYEQLRHCDLPVKIASLKVRRIQNGASISDLIDTLLVGLGPDLRTKLIKNVFSAIGSAVSEATEVRFDESFAEDNLRVVAAERLPVPLVDANSPISSVRFRLNLDDSSLASKLTKPNAGMALATWTP